MTSVCSTNNGCEGNAFLSCADSSQKIVNITFAAVGNLTQCPMPTLNQCSASIHKLFEDKCIGQTNCTGRIQFIGDVLSTHTRTPKYQSNILTHPKYSSVSRHAAYSGGPACLGDLGDTLLVLASAQCVSDGQRVPERRGNLLRFKFNLTSKPLSALVRVSAQGYHVLYCNGQRVSKRVLEPGRASVARIFFSNIDLAPFLRQGSNVIAVSLGSGWHANDGNMPGAVQRPPSFFLNGSAYLSDGSTVSLASNTSWKSGLSPITYDSVYIGERRDLRLTQPGWTESDFDDSQWLPVSEGDAGGKTLAEQVRSFRHTFQTRSQSQPTAHANDAGTTTCCGADEPLAHLHLQTTLRAVHIPRGLRTQHRRRREAEGTARDAEVRGEVRRGVR